MAYSDLTSAWTLANSLSIAFGACWNTSVEAVAAAWRGDVTPDLAPIDPFVAPDTENNLPPANFAAPVLYAPDGLESVSPMKHGSASEYRFALSPPVPASFVTPDALEIRGEAISRSIAAATTYTPNLGKAIQSWAKEARHFSDASEDVAHTVTATLTEWCLRSTFFEVRFQALAGLFMLAEAGPITIARHAQIQCDSCLEELLSSRGAIPRNASIAELEQRSDALEEAYGIICQAGIVLVEWYDKEVFDDDVWGRLKQRCQAASTLAETPMSLIIARLQLLHPEKYAEPPKYAERLALLQEIATGPAAISDEERLSLIQIIANVFFWSQCQISFADELPKTLLALETLSRLLSSPQHAWLLEKCGTELFNPTTAPAILNALIGDARRGCDLLASTERPDSISYRIVDLGNVNFAAFEAVRDFIIHAAWITATADPALAAQIPHDAKRARMGFMGAVHDRHLSDPIVLETRDLSLLYGMAEDENPQELAATAIFGLTNEIKGLPWEDNPQNRSYHPSRHYVIHRPLPPEFECPDIDFLEPDFDPPHSLWADLFGRETLIRQAFSRAVELLAVIGPINTGSNSIYYHEALKFLLYLVRVNPDFARRNFRSNTSDSPEARIEILASISSSHHPSAASLEAFTLHYSWLEEQIHAMQAQSAN